MCLRFEIGHHVFQRTSEHLEPRRYDAQWPVELARAEDQQRADRLRPRGAALGGSADDDVAGAELEAIPARAVEEVGDVPHGLRRIHGVHVTESTKSAR